MKVTVSEALRIKNELSAQIKKFEAFQPAKKALLYLRESTEEKIRYGVTAEDGVVIGNLDSPSVCDIEQKLVRLLTFSLQTNEILARYNATTGLTRLVMERQNAVLMINFYQTALSKSKEYSTNKWETVGNDRKKIQIDYTPYISTDELQSKILSLKELIRVNQQQVDKLNVEEVELPFEYKDLEEVLS